MLRLTCKLLLLLFFTLCSSCYKETVLGIVPDFEVIAVDENYLVPSEFIIKNKTIGADRYVWTFEGGNPAISTAKSPENIVFHQPGIHIIRLECWSGNLSASKEFELKLDPIVKTGFRTEIMVNAFAPADVKIVNQSMGSSFFEWTFEGGIPATSSEASPPLIHYEKPGTYVVRLTLGNDRKQYKSTDTIIILPRLQADFNLFPSFADEDLESPAVFYATNTSISNLQSFWEVSGGIVKNDTVTHPEFHFEKPGTYTITLNADNHKEKKSISKEITILPNTNLYTMKGVKMGISTSRNIGSFYSCDLRKVMAENEVNASNGKLIDFVFFGLNDRFSYCKFLSPDKADDFVFEAIPGAIKTFIVNNPVAAGIQLNIADFESMKNDEKLRLLEIKSKDSGDAYFQLESLPHLVLFETADGRKGAICVTQVEKAGSNSYIIADIKVQKKKNQ